MQRRHQNPGRGDESHHRVDRIRAARDIFTLMRYRAEGSFAGAGGVRAAVLKHAVRYRWADFGGIRMQTAHGNPTLKNSAMNRAAA